MESVFILSLLILTLIFSIFFLLKNSKSGKPIRGEDGQEKLSSIPKVSWSLPIIGHFLQITFYPESFLDSCYTQYGPVFQLHVLSQRLAFICERALFKEVWKNKDMENPNLFETLDVGDQPALHHHHIVNIVKKFAVEHSIQPQLFVEYAEKLVTKLGAISGGGKAVNVEHIFVQHCYEMLCHVFFGLDVSEEPELFQSFKSYSALTEYSMAAGFILPKWLIQWGCQWRLKSSLAPVMAFMERHVKSAESQKDVFRQGYAHMEDYGGGSFTVEQLSVGFLKLTTSIVLSFSAGLLNTLALLHQHPQSLKLGREEASRLMATKDYKGISESKILASFFMEACRLKTHYLGATCRIINDDCRQIEGYSLQDIDLVILGGNVSTAGAGAGDVYESPRSYQPSRWLNNGTTLHRPSNFPTFGGGRHYCLGKQGSIAAVNMTMAHFLTQFELDMDKTRISEVSTVFGAARSIKIKTCIRKIKPSL